MLHRTRRSMARFLVLLLIVTSLTPSLVWATGEEQDSTGGPTDIPAIQTPEGDNGVFAVWQYAENEWKYLGSAGFSHELETKEMNLYTATQETRLWIQQLGGRASHMDRISVGAYAPISVTAACETECSKLVYNDLDLYHMPRDMSGVEVVFSVPETESAVQITARIEGETLVGKPFVHPLTNGIEQITSHAVFYTYEMNDNRWSEQVDGDIQAISQTAPFFRDHVYPISGHPDGETYGWVGNDDENLYVVLDFTSDNTVDDSVDYAAVYVNVDGKVNQFEISPDKSFWGQAHFGYTNQASYAHTYYEFSIPLADIGVTANEPLQLAFELYGTAAQGVNIHETVYIPTTNQFFTAYVETTSNGSTVFGQFVAYDGTPQTPAIVLKDNQISTAVWSMEVVYNEMLDEVMVIWSEEDYDTYTENIYGAIVQSDGSALAETTRFKLLGDPSEREYLLEAVGNRDTGEIMILWTDYDAYLTKVSIIQPDLTVNTQTLTTEYLSFPQAAYFAGSNMYLVTWSFAEMNEVDGIIFNEDASVSSGAFTISEGTGTEYYATGITPTGDGNIVVSWLEYVNGLYDVYMRTIGPDGTKGTVQQLISGLSVQNPGSVHLDYNLTDDSYLYTWMQSADGLQLYQGQALTSTGSVSGSAITIASTSNNMNSQQGAFNTISGNFMGVHDEYIDGYSELVYSSLGEPQNGTIGFVTDTISVKEADTLYVMISRYDGLDGRVSFDYATSPITADSSDYTDVSGTIEMASGVSSAAIEIPIHDDQEVESEENFLIELSAVSGGALGISTIEVTIYDNDTAEVLPDTVGFTSINYAVSEPEGSVTLTLQRTGNKDTTETVEYQTVIGSADATDYTETTDIVTFDAGLSTKDIVIPITDDSTYEGSEVFLVSLLNYSSGLEGDENSITSVTISDPEDAEEGTITPTAALYTVNENDGSVIVTLTRSGDALDIATVDYATVNGTADETDYKPASGTVTFASGEVEKHIVITLLDDDMTESEEGFQLSLGSVTGGTLGSKEVVITIVDDDPATVFSFSSSAYSVNEDAGTITLSVDRTGDMYGEATVNYSTTEGTAGTADYTAASGSLLFADGETSKTVVLNITDDDSYEQSETFTVQLSGFTTNIVGGHFTSATVTIDDPEDLPPDVVAPTSTNYTVAEFDQSVQVDFIRTGSAEQEAEVTYTTVAGTASTDDFTAQSGKLSFSAGVSEAAIHIAITDDVYYEGSESFTVELSSVSGAALEVSDISITIEDDDMQPAVSFTAPETTVSETDGTMTATVIRGGNTYGEVIASYSTVNGTADDTDYTSTTGSVLFADGEIEKTITIAITDDVEYEGAETFTIQLTSLSGGAVEGPVPEMLVTINDEEDAPLAEISTKQSTYSFAEDVGSLLVTVERSVSTEGTASVDYETYVYQADAGDFQAISGTLVFDDGVSTKDILVTVNDNQAYEGDRTFKILFSNPVNAELTTSKVYLNVKDDDPKPHLSFTADVHEVDETDGSVQINVTRTVNTNGTCGVSYETVQGTAGGNDYTETSGTLTFLDGETSKTISIDIADDSAYERSESFSVAFTAYELAEAGTWSTTTVQIEDPEDAPLDVIESASTSYEVGEADGTVTVDLLRSGELSKPASLSYATVVDTASEADYTAASGTITFDAGVSEAAIVIDITDDTIDEDTETFTIVLSNPLHAEIADKTVHVAITDDDPPPTISFSDTTYSAREPEGSVTVTLVRDGDKTGSSSVYFTTVAGTADTNDYVQKTGQLVFSEGVSSQAISITLLNNSREEGTEQFTVNLFDVAGAELIAPSSATVTIFDDDEAEDEPAQPDPPVEEEEESPITSDEAADIQKKEDVKQLADELTSITESESVTEAQVDDVITSIETSIDEIESEEQLTEAVETYIQTIETVVTKVQPTGDSTWAEQKVVKSAQTFSKAMGKVTNDESVVKLTETYVEKLNELKVAETVKESKEIKKAVEEVARSVTSKLGKVKPVYSAVTVGETTELNVDSKQIEEEVLKKATLFKGVKDTLDKYYGEESVRDFKFEVTLEAERVNEEVKVGLTKETLDVMKANEVSAVGVKVGGTQLSVDQSLFESEEEDDQEREISFQMKFQDQTFEEDEQDAPFRKGYIADARVLVNNVEQKKLEKPARLSFDLDAFEFFDTFDSDLSSIYLLNEETSEWEPVGGVYDPVTESISVRRLHLSQYTVMQSNKSFADVENSWAKNDINALLNKGIVDEQTSFNPSDSITREEFTTWVTRAYGLTDDEATAQFEDLSEDAEHYAEVASAFSQGIISGRNADTFDPEGSITREEMAVILTNALEAYDNKKRNTALAEQLVELEDGEQVADWASEQVAMLLEMGLLEDDDGTIDPKGAVSKELAASILKKIYG